jgi:pimeloyl-ACP methyl ester carboxylesterase
MKQMFGGSLVRVMAAVFWVVVCGVFARGAGFVPVSIPGETLRGNPLGDPVARIAAVYEPKGGGGDGVKTLYYLPGYGGGSEEYLHGAGAGFIRVLQQLADSGLLVRLVVIDARNRFGGSQFLNSPAQGRYADYVLDEVIPLIEKKFGSPANARDRILAGHSSGGFGALRLAMRDKRRIGSVVALSPDTDFEVTHKGLSTTASMRSVRPADVEAYSALGAGGRRPSDGMVGIWMGLSAAYAPVGVEAPGKFLWLYDEKGRWRDDVWARWLEQDPVVIARRDASVFSVDQRIYLDGAERDEFKAQLGARALKQALSAHPAVEFYESPGGHSAHLEERLARGLEWVFGRPTRKISGR